jgi:hypothetical protein
VDGASGVSTTPTLSWNSAAGADSYNLQLTTQNNFTTPLLTASGIISTSYSVSSALAKSTEFQWRVQAANAGGTSFWTPAWRFTTLGNPTTLSSISGGGQSKPINTALDNPFIVKVTDEVGDPVTDVGVMFTISSVPSGATGQSLSVTNTTTDSEGFAGSVLTLGNRTGEYIVTVSSSGLTSVQFSATATPGTPSQLTITTQPSSSAQSGVAFAQQPVIQIRDSAGNPVNQSGVQVTAAIASGGGTLGGTATVSTNASGQASFTNLSITGTAGTRTLQFSSSGLTSVTSNNINITAGTATQLVITTTVPTTQAGVAISPALQVEIRDADGNLVTTANNQITIAIDTGPGGATLSGTTQVNAVNGVASFANLILTKAGSGYRLRASSGSLTTDQTNSFTVTPGPAAKLAYSVQPPLNTQAGINLSPAIQVIALDQFDNPVTSFNQQVTIALQANPGGATLNGTLVRTPSSGVASFNDLNITKSANGYSLRVTSSGLDAATSNTFNITPAPAAKLAFTQQPPNTTAGANFTVQVTARDQYDNTASAFNGQVTVSIDNNPGGGTLSGVTVRSASGGIVTFDNLSINKSGTGYTLKAAATGLTEAISNSFNITAGAASQLVITTTVSTVTAGSAISPPVTVEARDANGNLVTGFNSQVSMSLATAPEGATLGGTTQVTAANGIATFSNLLLTKAGGPYSLRASASGLSAGTSNSFSVIAGPATKLAFIVQPTNTQAGAVISPAVQVAALDQYDNTATAYNQDVTIAIQNNPSGGVLSGTTVRTTSNGTATFNDLSINNAGNNYTLRATSGSLTAATTTAFNIFAGSATKLLIVGTLQNRQAGQILTSFTVYAVDSNNNTDPNYSGTISISIANNPSGGTLSGTTAKSAVNGEATFNDLWINKVGTNYTLGAASGALTPAVTNQFDITHAAAYKIAITQQPPGTVIAGTAFGLSAEVLDQYDNRATSFNSLITVSLENNPEGGTLSGTTQLNASSGVAVFNNLIINKAGTEYSLRISASGLIEAISNQITVTHGTAASIELTGGTGSLTAGLQRILTATIKDAYGNTVTSGSTSSAAVTFSKTDGTGTVTGLGTTTAINGVATLIVTGEKAGSVTLIASITSPTINSNTLTFNVTAASPKNITAYSGTPQSTTVATAFSNNLQARVTDQFDNPVSGITVKFEAPNIDGAPGATFAASGEGNTNLSGVATAPLLTANTKAGSFTAKAYATGTDTASFALTNNPGTASKLTFNSIGSQLVGAPFAVTVRLTDQYENNVNNTGGSSNVTLGVSAGTGSLAGTTSGTLASGQSSITINGVVYSEQEQGVRLSAAATGGTADGKSGVSDPFDVSGSRIILAANPLEPEVDSETTLTATVTDAGGSPIQNVNVAFAIEEGTGELNGTNPSTTNSSGTVSLNYKVAEIVENALVKASLAVSPSVNDTVRINSLPGIPTHIVFRVQPSNTTAGAVITPAVEVEARDRFGNRDFTFSGQVTMSIENNPGEGTLSGTSSVNATFGVARFTNLRINRTGVGYTLRANAPSVGQVISASFNITPGAPSTIVKVSGDNQNNSSINSPLPEPFVAEVRDAQGNPVPGVQVGFAVSAQPADAGATVNPTTATTGADGQASTILTIGSKAGSYSVQVSSAGVSSQTFNAAVPVYTVSGRVTENGSNLANVQITASGGYNQVVITATNGTYSITGVPRGTMNIILTPKLEGFGFIPASIILDGPIQGNLANQNFAATRLTYNLTGQVRLSQSGFANVNVIAIGGHSDTVKTGADGRFTFTDVAHGATNISIFPRMIGYYFSPEDISISGPITGPLDIGSFSAISVTVTIEGRITHEGNGLNTVTVTASGNYTQTVQTNPDGNYMISGIPFGTSNIRIRPTKEGYLFLPTDTLFASSVTAPVSGVDFITVPPEKPLLAGPENESQGLETTLQLVWTAVTGAQTYSIEVASHPSFTEENIVRRTNDITGTEYTLGNLELGKFYYWRVRAVNLGGTSSWSDTWNFTTMNAAVHEIVFNQGWSMVSSYINPTKPDMREVFAIAGEELAIVKDGLGRVFVPSFDINDIGDWKPEHGYQVYFSSGSRMIVMTGIILDPDITPLTLTTGWNLISYIRYSPMDIAEALTEINDKIIIVKNNAGAVYIPEFEINDIDDMLPGEGYQVFLSEQATLVYPSNGSSPAEQLIAKQNTSNIGTTTSSEPEFFISVIGRTGSNAVFIVSSPDFIENSEVGVHDENGMLIGAGVVRNGRAVATVWGVDHHMDPDGPGAHEGDRLYLFVYEKDIREVFPLAVRSIQDLLTRDYNGVALTFETNAVLNIEVDVEKVEIPETFVLHQNFPNPFNPTTVIQFGLPSDNLVLLEVYNILGQRVAVLVDEERTAGFHQVTFDGSTLASGIYLYRLQAGTYSETKKFILIK